MRISKRHKWEDFLHLEEKDFRKFVKDFTSKLEGATGLKGKKFNEGWYSNRKNLVITYHFEYGGKEPLSIQISWQNKPDAMSQPKSTDLPMTVSVMVSKNTAGDTYSKRLLKNENAAKIAKEVSKEINSNVKQSSTMNVKNDNVKNELLKIAKSLHKKGLTAESQALWKYVKTAEFDYTKAEKDLKKAEDHYYEMDDILADIENTIDRLEWDKEAWDVFRKLRKPTGDVLNGIEKLKALAKKKKLVSL